MRGKSLLTMGFLSILAATVSVSVPNGFAANAQETKKTEVSNNMKKADDQVRVDIVDELPKDVQFDSMTPGYGERKDVIDEVGSKGDEYPSTGAGTRKDVIEKIND